MRAPNHRSVLITGATDGLGRALATHLAATGMTVLLHGRDDERGRRTVAEIARATGNHRLFWYCADLADLTQVRGLAAAVARDRRWLTDLVNNAGIGTTVPGGGKRQESRDGHELRFAVNYLAGFLLTRMLTGMLAESAPARVVMVSSAGQSPIDLDDVMLTRGYSGTEAYCRSKLAQIMFAIDLAEELSGTGVTVNALHPADYMPTKLVQTPRSTLEAGVRATARLLLDPELDGVGGQYFDGLVPALALPQAYDVTARRRLRELSERLTRAPVIF